MSETQSTRKVMKLSDEFIFQLVRTLQLAMLTGTNIADHLRQFRIEQDPISETPQAILTPEYQAYFDKMIENMVEKAEEEQAREQEEVNPKRFVPTDVSEE